MNEFLTDKQHKTLPKKPNYSIIVDNFIETSDFLNYLQIDQDSIGFKNVVKTDLISVLNGEYYFDGYEIAKRLERKSYYNLDSEAVEILNEINWIAYEVNKETRKDWVKAYDINIDTSIINTIVEIKTKHKEYSGKIIKIDAQYAQLYVEKNATSSWIIDIDKITNYKNLGQAPDIDYRN